MCAAVDSQRVTVLTVTADDPFGTACREQLPTQADLAVETVSTVSAAITRLVEDDTIDCIVSDHDLPDTDGIAFLETVRSQAPTLPFVLFTSGLGECPQGRPEIGDFRDHENQRFSDDLTPGLNLIGRDTNH